jgi:tape measure domain-containing protein
MAVSNEDLARLVVSLEATTTKYYNALRKAQQQTNTSASAIEKRLTGMAGNIDKTFANLGKRLSANLTGPLAGIGAALSVREVLEYADAWTLAKNQLSAASDITGVQARSLQDLRKVADQSRAGFEETVKLYTRILRSTSDVAKSEEDVARATSIVNKAFKAGGAATSEFNAGVLQLSQGLGSGVLQGDELRSVRENAPVLAKVIADFFGVTVAGLKELGSEGKLTSDKVFAAILSGEKEIDSAFATTQATIADGVTRVRNALIEYIGSAAEGSGVTLALNAGLNLLADNMETVGDVVLKLAALIAGALVGRSLVSMVKGLVAAGEALSLLLKGMEAVRKSGGGLAAVLGTAFGPIVAVQELAASSLKASANIKSITDEMNAAGIVTRKTTAEIREQATATDELTEAQKRLNEAKNGRDSLNSIRAEGDIRGGNLTDNLLGAHGGPFTTAIEDLKSFNTVASRAKEATTDLFSGLNQSSKSALIEISNLANGLDKTGGSTKEAVAKLRELQQIKGLDSEVLRYIDTFDKLLIEYDQIIVKQHQLGTSPELVNLSNQLADALNNAKGIPSILNDIADDDQKIAFTDSLEKLSQGIRDGTVNAKDAQTELTRLGGISATFGNILPKLLEMVTALAAATEQAQAFQNLDTRSGQTSPRGAVGAARREREENEAAGQKFIDQQKEYNKLSSEERDIQEEIAKIVKDAKKDGTNLSDKDDRVRQLAIENLALKASDRAATKSSKDATKDQAKFDKTISDQEKANEALQQEYAIRQGLNPLINDYGYALEKQQKTQELLNAAKEAGITIDEDLMKKIDLIADIYATGTAAIDRQREAQEELKKSVQDWADLGKSATRGFIDDLIEGKSAAEALGNVLGQLGDKLIDMGLNTLFGTGSGANPLGLLGQLFQPRASGGPVSKGQSYIVGEKRPEVFVPNQNGVIIPRVPNNMGGSGSVTAPIQINIDAKGADAQGLMRVQQELVNLRAQMPYLVRNQVSKRTQKGW